MNHLESAHLENVYYDVGNPAAFGGVQRLSKATALPRQTVEQWLQKKRTYTLHKPVRRRFPVRRYKVTKIDQQWQADLVEMIPHARQNQNYRYLMTMIDVFSRYAWAVPLHRKTPEEVIHALESIFSKDHRKPRFLQTDEGTEFENRKVRAFLDRHGIHQFSVKSQFKAALVERFNRTLKTKMWRVFTHRGNYTWIDIIDSLVSAYNHSIHRVLGMAPAEVNDDNEVNVFLHQYRHIKKPTHRKATFAIGDSVRISKVKGLFEKGYLPNWSEEIFAVHEVNRKYYPITYRLKDHRGEVLEGSFYDYELQAVDDTDQVYTIERLIRTRTRGGHKQYLVKWLGYDETSWIGENDFHQLT